MLKLSAAVYVWDVYGLLAVLEATVWQQCFNTYTVSIGGSPACYGIIGCLFVELFQNWKIIEISRAPLLSF